MRRVSPGRPVLTSHFILMAMSTDGITFGTRTTGPLTVIRFLR